MRKSIQLFSIFLFSFLLLSNYILAQEKLTLKQCIDYALKNNISIQQTALNVDQNEYKLIRDRAARYPSASAFASHGYSFGNSLDYTTYEYVKQTTQSNYFSLSSDITLFNGMRINNTIKADQFDILSSKHQYQNIKDQVSLTLAAIYLEIIMNFENISFSKEQVALTEKLLERGMVLVEVGQETDSKIYELKAQLANDEVSLVEATNSLEQSYLSLKQIMNYDISKKLTVFEIDINPDKYSNYVSENVEDFLENSVAALPNVKVAEATLERAKFSNKATKALYYPSLGASGSLNSRYSDATPNPAISPDPFTDQLDNNFGQQISFGLNIPIFNNYQNTYAVKVSEIAIQNAAYELQETKISAKNDIYEAYYLMKNANKKFEASKNSYEAQQLYFNQSNIKYNEGIINFYEWQTAKNALSKSQTDFLRAKYDYIYRIKIYEYYKGIPISL